MLTSQVLGYQSENDVFLFIDTQQPQHIYYDNGIALYRLKNIHSFDFSVVHNNSCNGYFKNTPEDTHKVRKH